MKGKLHHHHRKEAEHLKERAKHHSAMHERHGHESGGIPAPKMAKDNHQVGIARKLQRKGDMDIGQHGSMSGGWKHEEHMEALVPKRG